MISNTVEELDLSGCIDVTVENAVTQLSIFEHLIIFKAIERHIKLQRGDTQGLLLKTHPLIILWRLMLL